MIIAVSFNDVKVNEDFLYLSKGYRKIVKPNGKIGAMDLISQQIYPDCKHWINCFVFRSDTQPAEITSTNPNRTTFSIVNNDGELYDIIALTPSQKRLIEWLGDNEYLSEDITIVETSPMKITEI